MPDRPSYGCRDCGIDIDRKGEYAYMLRDRIWKQATTRAQKARPGLASTEDLCCARCFERRLGRPLTYLDFNWRIPLNIMQAHRSRVLREAMSREP